MILENRETQFGEARNQLLAHSVGEVIFESFRQDCYHGTTSSLPLSAYASVPQRAPLAIEQTGFFAWWHLERVNLLRELAGAGPLSRSQNQLSKCRMTKGLLLESGVAVFARKVSLLAGEKPGTRQLSII
jgi:hypothetical protein